MAISPYNPKVRFPLAVLLTVAAANLSSSDIPAPPAIEPDGIWNAASLTPPSLPGGPIARGARIAISGVRLGPESEVRTSESAPPAILAGVSVRIVAGGSTVTAPLLAVSARRIEAWIPESIETGPTRLTVTYEGRESEPYALEIQPSGFGFFGGGERPESVAGQTVTLRGTGLGGSDLEIFVGGKVARRSPSPGADPCCKGVYSVSFEVPADAPLGCYVPVIGRSRVTGRPTNFTTISIHRPGERCRDRGDWFRESVERATSAGFAVLARVSIVIRDAGEYVFDYGLASFGRQESGRRPFPPFPPPGTCTGFADRVNLREVLAQSRAPGSWPGVVKPAPGNRALDAGNVSFRGPRGVRIQERPGVLGGRVPFSRGAPSPLFAVPGPYSVSATGGRDIGGFTVAIPVPRPLVWKNRTRLDTVDRAAGITVEWAFSRKEDAVLIVAASADHFTGDSAMCVCMAPSAAGRFAIPPLALANLPPTDPRKPDFSYLLLLEIPVEPPARIQATGLDSAFAAFLSASVKEVAYR